MPRWTRFVPFLGGARLRPRPAVPSISHVFVGASRLEAVREFVAQVGARRRLVAIHGAIGTGKTELLRRFELGAHQKDALTARAGETDEPIPVILGRLAEMLEEAGAPLGQFGEAFRRYRERLAKLGDEDALKGALEVTTSGLARGVVRVARHVPGVGIAGELLNEEKIADAAGKAAVGLREKRTRTQALDLVEDPVGALTRRFLADVDALDGRRVALFIDSAQNGRDSGERFDELDRWLQALARGEFGAFPERLVLTIASRRELDHAAWSGVELLQRVALAPLTEDEAREFVQASGILDPEIVTEILARTSRTPRELAVVVSRRPTSAAEIRAMRNPLVEGLLDGLRTDAQRQVVSNAAIPRVLNHDVLRVVLDRADVYADFRWLVEQEFVSETVRGPAYVDSTRLHLLRRRRLESPHDVDEIHGRLTTFYAGAREELGTDESLWRDAEWQGFELERAYHRASVAPRDLATIANAFMRALAGGRDFARRLAEAIRQAGRERELDGLRTFGEALVAGMTSLDEVETEASRVMFSGILALADVEPRWRAKALDWRGYLAVRADRAAEALPDLDAALALLPEVAEYRVDRALALQMLGRNAEALTDLDIAVKIDPDSSRTLAFRAAILLAEGEFDAALADVERALVLDPNNVTARPLQVDLLQVLDRIDEAISRVEALVELLPGRASVHATRARLLVQVGRIEEGAAASERALELSGREYDVLSQHALLLVNAGMADTASAVAIELFERAPEGAAALQREFVHLSPTQLERHGPFLSKLASLPISDAMRQLRLLAAGGDPAVALLRASALSVQAAAALARTDWSDALQHYDRALEFDPENGAVRRSRALVRTLLGQTAEALDDLTRAIESEPGDSASLGFRAQLLHASGRNEEALADITRAIALAPHDFLIAEFGVRFHLLRGEATEAARLARVIAEKAGEYLDQLVAARRTAGGTIDALRSKLGGVIDPADPKAPLLRLARTDRAAALASIEAEAFELESSARLAHGELEEALAAMNRALAVSPPHPRRLSRRAAIFERLGRNDEALADAHAVLATEPDHLPTILMSARLHQAANDLPSAIDHLRRAVALTPADYALRAWFAGLLGRTDDLTGASTELDIVAEHAGEFLDQILEARARGIQDVPDLTTTAERIAVAGLLLDAERDRDAAILTVRTEAASMRVQARLRDKDADGVVAALTEVIALGASGADTYALRGDMLRLLGRLDEAHADLTRALALDESSAWAHGTMGQLLVTLDRPSEALEHLDRAVSLQPELGWARLARAEVLGQLERLEESLAEFRNVLAAEPANMRALDGLADRLRLLGRFDEALSQAEHGLAGAPDDPELRRQRALILHLLGRSADAAGDAEHLVRLAPSSVPIVALAAELLALIGGITRARELLDALVSDADSDWVLYLRSLVRNDLGDVAGARSDIDAAITRAEARLATSPHDAETEANLRLYYLARRGPGDADEAERWFDTMTGDRPWRIRSAVRDLETLAILRRDDLATRIAERLRSMIAPYGAALESRSAASLPRSATPPAPSQASGGISPP